MSSGVNVKLTTKAIEQLKTEYGFGGEEEKYLLLYAEPGGCAGMKYQMGVSEGKDEEDVLVFDKDGIKAVAPLSCVSWLNGLEIDYSDDLISPGFRIVNPSAKQSCGCGSSFSV